MSKIESLTQTGTNRTVNVI